MFVLATLSSICLLSFALLYVYWGQRCIRLYQNQTSNSDYTPVATVILSVRGNDPFLTDCLKGLLNQDYPNYTVKIIVDHLSDPAWKLVDQYLQNQRHSHCEVSVRENHSGGCGLKNASLVQALSELDDDVEVVAWLDSDVVPHQSWLRDLVAPLQDPQVGVTSGIRWYAPRDTNVGTLVRHAWNAAAVIQVLSLEIAWGGSIALSRAVFQNPHLQNSFSKMMWEDSGLKSIASELNKELAFAPAATMVNAESTSFSSCFQFITRQLLNARFYHAKWSFIATVGLTNAIAQTMLILLAVFFLTQGNLLWAGISAGVLVFSGVCVTAIIYRMSSLIHQLVRDRGEEFQRRPLRTAAVLWLTIYVYCAALITAIRTKTIDWRGVSYHVPSPFEVQITHYEPYRKPIAMSEQLELENISL
ncbi:glycosyltransferase [Gimesia aquarii]|uniref:N-glycosyltransferase n=1 Tax=Gimesia aquarii TaxID=2527964 RepID=A0A517WNB7_9PLAN|nr:glycosyltransferase family 2 protein [Gimesia aquarii]QDU06723.1 N-glycosyltransferase [Gimesia aquarii]